MESIALTEAVFYILLSLETPLHGYGIMQNTEKLSNGRIHLAAGTLYGAINTLLDKKWICAVSENELGRKKEYCLTEAGRIALKNELNRLKELVANGDAIMGRWN